MNEIKQVIVQDKAGQQHAVDVWPCDNPQSDCGATSTVTDEACIAISDNPEQVAQALASMRIDANYVRMQMAHALMMPCPTVECRHMADCCQRALDALERIQTALDSIPTV